MIRPFYRIRLYLGVVLFKFFYFPQITQITQIKGKSYFSLKCLYAQKGARIYRVVEPCKIASL